MYIQPNTNIKIYKNVPLDNSYQHTINFTSLANQSNYFHATLIPKYSLTNQTYQRVNKNRIRVELLADNIYDCNYLAFQNSAYGNKWFYAFITKIEWINNVTSEIEFDIDVMQTYMFDVELKPCFIEREHVTNDTKGINRIPENLETGDFVTVYDVPDLLNSRLCAVMVTTGVLPNGTGSGAIGYLRPCEEQYTALSFFAINPDNPNDYAGSCLQMDVSKMREEGVTDGIVAVFRYPIDLMLQNDATTGGTMPMSFVGTGVNFNFTGIDKMTRVYRSIQKSIIYDNCFKEYIGNMLESYVPKNNKLYNDEYVKCVIENGNGGTVDLNIEKFNGSSLEFWIYGCYSLNGETRLIPFNYDDIQSQKPNNEYGLDGGGYPQSAWVSNAYASWLNSNGQQWKASNIMGTIGGLGSIATAKNNKDKLGVVYGFDVASRVVTNLAKVSDLKHIPDSVKGKQSNTVNCETGYSGFNLKVKTVNPIIAKAIDDYFSIYGYQVNDVKVPSRSNRRYWTYIKTAGCKAVGGCPTDDINKIQSIYDSGITFWNNPSEVGNYLDAYGNMRDNPII